MGACTSKSVLKNVDDAPLPEVREEVVAVEVVKAVEVVAAPPAVAGVEETQRESLGLLIEENKEEIRVSSEIESEKVKQVDEPKECAEAVAVVVETMEVVEKDIIETSDGIIAEVVEVSDIVEVSEEKIVKSVETEASEKVEEKNEEVKSKIELTSEDTKVEEEKKAEEKKPLFKLWF